MLQLRVSAPTRLTDDVVAVLIDDPAVTGLTVHRGASVKPAGNAVGLGAFAEVWGSTLQLTVNLSGMAVPGWLTLALQNAVWARMHARHARKTGTTT